MTEVPADIWEGHSAEELARRWGAPAVHLFQEVGSTNDVCRRLAAEGATGGAVVLSEKQTAGRGRGGKRWESPAGSGLWISFLTRPTRSESQNSLPLVMGLVTASCLQPLVAPGVVGIKWPNDLQIEGLKIGGILCESVWHGASPVSLIVGIGLNLRQERSDFPAELRELAASVRSATGKDLDRFEVASCLVPSVLGRLREPLALSPSESIALQEKDVLRGRDIHLSGTESSSPNPTAVGIAPDGALLIRDAEGILRPIHSGTVRPV
jgi:BirA family transcriptional regulator, biotin operon repressor / biotin---[acetyl-CoA-carboxylase] ligase